MFELFVSKPDEYIRDINPMSSYIKLSSYYLAKMTGDDIDTVKDWLSEQLVKKNPKIIPEIPNIEYLSKEVGNCRDRVKVSEPLDKYIHTIATTDRIIAPSGTVYKHPKYERSMFTYYVDEGRTQRNHFKYLMHEAKLAGRTHDADFNNELQNACKIDNNTLSGAQMSPATIIHTQSAHPSMTSTCRVSTTIANLLNERMLVGNMHYMTPNIVLEHITALAYTTKHDAVMRCIEQFGLYVPTTDDVITIIRNSTQYYFKIEPHLQTFINFLDRCTDTEKCNIVYNGSFWNLIRYNPELMFTILDDMSEPADISYDFDKSKSIFDASYEALTVLAISLCHRRMRGKSMKNIKDNDHVTYGYVAATVDKLLTLLKHYEWLFLAFFKITILPNNIYDVETMYRLTVVTSDTDSTNFTCQEICKFMSGKYGLTDKDTQVTFLLTYFSSMITCQALGIVSTNLGVETPRIREIAMKNEFFIPIHCLTTSAKNYIMVQGAQEGGILPELDIVTKGVELRNSAIPKLILDRFDSYKRMVFLSIAEGKDLYMYDVLKPFIDLEREILDAFNKGSTKFMASIHVKTPDSYSNEEEASQWKYHQFYMDVFAPKYGEVADVPYVGYLATVDLSNKTKLNKWIESIKDPNMKRDVKLHVEKYKLTKINKMVFPDTFFSDNPLPAEIQDVLVIKSMVMRVMSPWYLLFESFGIFIRNTNDSRLISHVFGEWIDNPNPKSRADLECMLDTA